MGMIWRELQTITGDFSGLGHEAKVLNDLYEASETEALRTLTQIVFRHNAEAMAVEIEAALTEASHHLESLALDRAKARAEVRAIGDDLDAARADLEKVGWGKSEQLAERERAFSPEQRAVNKLSKDFREAGKAAQDVSREYWRAEKRVDVMEKMVFALRSVGKADLQVLTDLAEALAEALNTAG